MVGVCGGYQGESTDNCGHILSEMNLYSDSKAETECRAMVEKVRAYQMARARQSR